MNRRTFDFMVSTVGAILTAALIVAGVLFFWGYHYANTTVHNQLAAQQIYFPPKGSDALKPKEIGPFLDKYAGQQVVNGAQAQAYADHFIAVHLKEIGGGQTYSQLSAKALANPNDQALQGEVATVFKGTTLRGMLLNAYGWWKMGQLALIGSIAAFALALVLGILTILGFAHLRKADPADQVLVAVPTVKERITA
jgi:hypothetical protein